MAHAAAMPIVTAEGGLTRYLEEIRRFPMLEPQEEFMLAKSWKEHGDRDAAHRLVTSHFFIRRYSVRRHVNALRPDPLRSVHARGPGST